MGLLALCSPGQLNPEERVEQESGLVPAPPLLKISLSELCVSIEKRLDSHSSLAAA